MVEVVKIVAAIPLTLLLAELTLTLLDWLS